MSSAELPTLHTRRLVLRHLRPGDAAALLAIFGDPDVTRFWSRPPLEGLPAARELVEEIHQLARAGSLFQWGITHRDRERVIGTCTLADIEPRHRRAEIGFAVGRADWGQGIAGEAAGAVVAHAFADLDLHRLTADVDPRNTASIRLLQRLGFRPEGHLREHFRQSGEWQDGLLFGLLRREWAAASPGPSGE